MKFQSKTKIGIFIGAVVILLVIGVLFFCIAKPSTSDEIKTSLGNCETHDVRL